MRLLLTLVLFIVLQTLQAQPLTNASFQLVNSLYDELNPVLSPDGKTLFFTIANHPKNIGGKLDQGDIWYSQWTGTQWSSPTHAGTALNDRAYNGVAGISNDGTHLFLLSHYTPEGSTAKSQGISVSLYTGNGWTKPENIYIPYFQNKSGKLCGTISSDHSVFVFSAETYGTLGVEDIYVTINQNGQWSQPKNLGSMINTPFQELSPSLSTDGKTLYFSTNGREGKGSFDVYSATRLDDSWTNWTPAKNLGANVNTEGRELYYRNYPTLGFALYTSTQNSDGYGDISVYQSDDIYVKEDTAVTVLIPEVKADSIYTKEEIKGFKVYGRVKNAKTGLPVSARIVFSAPGMNNQTSSSSVSGYALSIPPMKSYTVKIEAAGYISIMERLILDQTAINELEANFDLQPLAIGTTVNLKSVLFVQTRAELLPESYDELDLVVNFLKENPNVRIELSGHTDNRGIAGDNQRLSQLRVETVKKYLVSKGIDAKRITGKGYGGTRPIASNETEESRRMNRRVEFTIKKF
jgi:OOP family OmpA-OmpF porin